jgi:acyl-CoA reductase-like NAD-dependent aldehyde dehydrogenase
MYRLAEVTESRTPELIASLVRAGASASEAATEVALTIDRTVYYAGMCDKVSALLASHNPVSGPHFGFSVPEATGVVAIVVPQKPVLLGLASTLLPVIATGNTAVLLASEFDPRTAIVFAECLATSDMPGGVANILTGKLTDLAPHLAKHREVNGFEAHVPDTALATELERLCADSVKRAKVHTAPVDWLSDRAGQGLTFVERYLETKSIWHPSGL